MTRPAFNRAAFVAAYRKACIEADHDPATGNPNANSDPMWWARDLSMWENGPNHSAVEAEALASIAAQVRRIAGVPEPETLADAVRAAWDEDGARRMKQMEMPLRDMYAARGETVELIAGLRMIVPIKAA